MINLWRNSEVFDDSIPRIEMCINCWEIAMMKRIETLLKNCVMSKKAFCIVVTAFFAVCIIPLIWIGKFNVMSADDFAYGVDVHNTWMSTYSLWESIKEAGNVVTERYFSWQGTYSSIFFMALNPLIFNDSLRFVIPIVFIGLYSFSTIYFIFCLFQTLGIERKCESWGVFIIALIENIVFVLSIDSPVEGFFWYNGATHYMFMHALMLFFLGMFLSLNRIIGQGKIIKKILFLLLYIISAIIVGGGNYISALQCIEIVVILIVVQALIKKLSVWHVSGFLILCIGFLTSVLAPGNSIRQGSSNGMGAIKAILNSFVVAIKDIPEWTTPIFVVGMLLIIPILYNLSKKVAFDFKYPLLVIGLVFCLYSSLYAPCLYGVGNVDSGRMRNIIQTSFYLYFVVALFYLLGNFGRKVEKGDRTWKKDIKEVFSIVSRYKMQYLWLMIVVMGAIILFTGDKNYYSSVSAFRSIVIGEAREYYNQAVERQRIIEGDEMDIYFEPFSVKPHVLFYADYVTKDDANNWINRTAANYFGKNSIQLKE